MEKEFIFSDFANLVNEKDRISDFPQESKWQVVQYTTEKCEGNLITTMQTGYPEDVTIDLCLEGLYQIYICVPRFFSATNYLNIKVSDDLCFTGLSASFRTPCNWKTEEFMEEIYWKTADLTGKKIIISKPASVMDSVTAISWIRCVPVEEMPPAITNKCVQMHNDEDVAAQEVQKVDDDYLMKVYPLKDTAVEFLSFEISFDYDGVADPKKDALLKHDIGWFNHFNYREKTDTIYKKVIDYAHKNDFKIYAANRMSVANFVFPYTRECWNCNFVEDNPQFHLKSRIGKTTKVCSYAYDQVQDFVIKNFTDALRYGFDGITLIMHRGMHIGFDEPVIKRFKELYPDVDPCTLPVTDERLHGVWCEFMNKFMTKLRTAVGKDIKINTITDYSLATSKHMGLDVEYWAKHGLIDSAAQADMETFENLEGCMSDENPDLIDLEKYTKELTKRHVLMRRFGCNVDKICDNIPSYRKLKDLYGTAVYHTLPWVGRKTPEEYPEIIERMEKAGAEKFLSWNTNHLLRDLPEWHTVSRVGNAPLPVTLRKYHRVLSLDGNYIAEFQSNWRG